MKEYGGPQGIGHPISRAEWGADREEVPETKDNYYFTFGFGHKLVSYCKDETFDDSQLGIPLVGKYVKISATNEDAARVKMFEVFGHAWASMFDENRFNAFQRQYHYTELMTLEA